MPSLSLFASRRLRRRFAVALCALACLLLLAACEDRDAPTVITGETPSGANLPRTSMPMPPLTAPGRPRPNPNDFGFMLLDGRRELLPDYRGSALVLDFYATYCPPCRDAIPHLNALQNRYGPEGLRIVGLNVGGEDDRRLVPQFVSQLGIAYPLGNPDPELVEALMAGNTAIPQTFIFDRQGRLVRHIVGYDQAIARELDDAVRAALATSAE